MIDLYLARIFFNFEKIRQYVTGEKKGDRFNIYLQSRAYCYLLYSYVYCIWLSDHKNNK